eukprot:gene1819-961_t
MENTSGPQKNEKNSFGKIGTVNTDVNEICNLFKAQKIENKNKNEQKNEKEKQQELDEMIVEDDNEELNYLISNMDIKEKPQVFMPYIF